MLNGIIHSKYCLPYFFHSCGKYGVRNFVLLLVYHGCCRSTDFGHGRISLRLNGWNLLIWSPKSPALCCQIKNDLKIYESNTKPFINYPQNREGGINLVQKSINVIILFNLLCSYTIRPYESYVGLVAKSWNSQKMPGSIANNGPWTLVSAWLTRQTSQPDSPIDNKDLSNQVVIDSFC